MKETKPPAIKKIKLRKDWGVGTYFRDKIAEGTGFNWGLNQCYNFCFGALTRSLYPNGSQGINYLYGKYAGSHLWITAACAFGSADAVVDGRLLELKGGAVQLNRAAYAACKSGIDNPAQTRKVCGMPYVEYSQLFSTHDLVPDEVQSLRLGAFFVLIKHPEKKAKTKNHLALITTLTGPSRWF